MEPRLKVVFGTRSRLITFRPCRFKSNKLQGLPFKRPARVSEANFAVLFSCYWISRNRIIMAGFQSHSNSRKTGNDRNESGLNGSTILATCTGSVMHTGSALLSSSFDTYSFISTDTWSNTASPSL